MITLTDVKAANFVTVGSNIYDGGTLYFQETALPLETNLFSQRLTRIDWQMKNNASDVFDSDSLALLEDEAFGKGVTGYLSHPQY